MSRPAMYRYFTARDELLVTLVSESFEDFADALDEAVVAARRRSPEGRLRAVLDAARQWAITEPHRYRLIFGSTYGSGELDSQRIGPASQRSMNCFLVAMEALRTPQADLPEVGAAYRRQLRAWNADRGGDEGLGAGLLTLGVATWTRAHDTISLVIEGAFANMGLDPADVFRQVVDDVVSCLDPN